MEKTGREWGNGKKGEKCGRCLKVTYTHTHLDKSLVRDTEQVGKGGPLLPQRMNVLP